MRYKSRINIKVCPLPCARRTLHSCFFASSSYQNFSSFIALSQQLTKEIDKCDYEDDLKIVSGLRHPVYGELVANLGYKKLYKTTLRTVTQLAVWKREGPLAAEHAASVFAENGAASDVEGKF